jgi:hypothetical protein
MKIKPLIYIVEDICLLEMLSAIIEMAIPGEVKTRLFTNPEVAFHTFLETGERPQVLQASLCCCHGLQLAGRIKAIDPSIRFLLTSGWHVSEREIKEQKVTPDAFLPKPFGRKDYMLIIRILLDGKPLVPLGDSTRGYSKFRCWPFHALLKPGPKKT